VSTCKTCKHWNCGDSGDGDHQICLFGVREPSRSMQVWKMPNNAVGHEDDYFGGWDPIETGPDFGCIHWEKKDE